MATHTTTGGNYGRKFSISRENGQTANKGRPHFFEWIPQLPADPGKRKLETRTGKDGSPKYYELFSALDGYLTAVNCETITNNTTQKQEVWVVAYMTDGPEEYVIQIGQIDNRYATDFLKRILDANFDPTQRLRLAPVESQATATSKGGLFLSAYSGPNKLEAKNDSPHLAGIPRPETAVFDGETKYNWKPVGRWLYEQFRVKVMPQLKHDPISAPRQTAPAAAPTATYTPQANAYQGATTFGGAPQPPSNAVPVNANIAANHGITDDDLPF
jgi:hypothetical protein